MFIPSDIYTTSGPNVLYGYWNANVTKHDANSFYNWEQDNEPILDLEERSYFLWEKAGHPTSSLTGFGFTVSAEATQTCNGRFYGTLSSLIERLPNVINYPILIEVASYGDLGNLDLNNIKFGPRGSLEIINRNFANSESSTTVTNITGIRSRSDSSYGIASSIYFADPTLVSDHNTYLDIPSVVNDFIKTYCVTTSGQVFSATPAPGVSADPRLVGNLSVFTKLANPASDGRLTAALAYNNPTTPWATNPASGLVSFTPYEFGTGITNDYINSYDASCINELDSTEVVWNTHSGSLKESVALAYGNTLRRLTINNCDGPIFIRNFTVDGGGSDSDYRNYGIHIVNSTGVVIENCAASRCRVAGLAAFNSSFAITRGFVAYRNYNFLESNVREGISWNSKIAGGPTPKVTGAGILLENSVLDFSSTLARDVELYTAHYVAMHDIVEGALESPPLVSYGSLICLSRNSTGIEAINSLIRGGQKENLDGIHPSIGYYNGLSITSELNTESGINLINSVLELDGKLIIKGNFKGITAKNSNLLTDVLNIKFNQKAGIELVNSNLNYNKNLTLSNNGNPSVEASTYKFHQNSFLLNGQHIVCKESIFGPVECSGMPSVYGRFVASGNFGVVGGIQLPAISIMDSSKLRVINLGLENSVAFTQEDSPVYGQAISVLNNSELLLQGTSSFATKLIGPATVEKQRLKSGLYAGENSTIELNGPTVIGNYSIDILAEDNSTIDIGPPKKANGSLDVNGMSLESAGNHTKVELHSTRACIVVNRNSTLKTKDLGDYRLLWANGTYGAAQLESFTYDYTPDEALYLSAGYLQFYPNPNDLIHYPPAIEDAPGLELYTGQPSFSLNGNGFWYFLEDAIGNQANQSDFSSVTFGGVCVRAVNGSVVDILNTHFPASWWNPSGIVYDISGADTVALCNRTFIWNIADNSLLTSKYTSVSGLHPADTSYHGPRGTWNGFSAAPISTPDTSSVSLLDFYGAGSGHPFSKSTYENLGPFRLYFSVRPETNWLVTSSLTLSGFIPQVYAQGYQFSSNLVAPGNTSSFYTSLQFNENGVITASGFFYGSSLLANPTMVKAILDDSSSNVFANSKHCSVGKSGLGKVVSILFPYTDIYGGDSAGSSSKSAGRGFRSTNVFDLERDN